jgi:lipoprotein Spr
MKLQRYTIVLLVLLAVGCAAPRKTTHNNYKSVEEKYAQMLGVQAADISNKKLYGFIDDWYGVPYAYGGKTKRGVDCSGFTSVLLNEVYGKQMSGSSSALYGQCRHIGKEELKEGDLVFFRIDSKDISHVGIYLQNNKFIHASTKAGVIYKKYFAGGGKVN